MSPLQQIVLERRKSHTTTIAAPETKLTIARKQLQQIDKRIAKCLTHFKAASNQNIQPTTELISQVSLPTAIENLAIDTNTPKELFAGVALFLKIKTSKNTTQTSKEKKINEFTQLCHLLCERHETSRLVFEHKITNINDFKDEQGKVITFIPTQHSNVVTRMHRNTTESYQIDGALSANIIGWVAAVNAGWQDMGINEGLGPFKTPVQKGQNYTIRDPRPLHTI